MTGVPLWRAAMGPGQGGWGHETAPHSLSSRQHGQVHGSLPCACMDAVRTERKSQGEQQGGRPNLPEPPLGAKGSPASGPGRSRCPAEGRPVLASASLHSELSPRPALGSDTTDLGPCPPVPAQMSSSVLSPYFLILPMKSPRGFLRGCLHGTCAAGLQREQPTSASWGCERGLRVASHPFARCDGQEL